MSHYEERLQADLDRIRALLAELGKSVDVAINQAVEAVLHADQDLASRVILGDHPINRATRDLDRRCHAFVARHLPSAGHLRFISSVMRILVAAERVGDYAVTVCRETVQLNATPPDTIIDDIRVVGTQVEKAFSLSMDSFIQGDLDLARDSVRTTGKTRKGSSNVFEDLAQAADAKQVSIRDAMALLVVLNRLERIGDQAKNICEETVFAITGETKHPKVYRVLFVDKDGTRAAKMAECIARKAFPESGEFACAGIQPAEQIQPELAKFLDDHGHNPGSEAPQSVGTDLDRIGAYHVVVDLEGNLHESLSGVPFHTVLIRWPLEEDHSLESMYAALSSQIEGLMHTLRGQNAS